MRLNRFFLFQTNEFDRLVDCVVYSMYSTNRSFYEKELWADSKQIGKGD